MPWPLRKYIGGHEVFSAQYMKWSHLVDRDLLQRAAQRFDVVVTCDQAIWQSLNPAGQLAVIIIKPCILRDMVEHADKIIKAINMITPGTIVTVEIPATSAPLQTD
jgi:hypothetical protein